MIEENAQETPFSGGEYLHPRQVLRELEKAMPEDVMVSTDIGNINSVANSYLRFEKPRSFFAAMSLVTVVTHSQPLLVRRLLHRIVPLFLMPVTVRGE